MDVDMSSIDKYVLLDLFTLSFFSVYLCKNNHSFEAIFLVELISFPQCLFTSFEYVN